MKFTGKVQFRSSRNQSAGPPGEAQILALNPQRKTAILDATGWKRLVPGSLNLEVDPGVVTALEEYRPVIEEPWASITYPPPFQSIPQRRGGYYYYRAIASRGDHKQDVLVRRAINPIRDRVELFAPVKLTKTFMLRAGDLLTVDLLEGP